MTTVIIPIAPKMTVHSYMNFLYEGVIYSFRDGSVKLELLVKHQEQFDPESRASSAGGLFFGLLLTD